MTVMTSLMRITYTSTGINDTDEYTKASTISANSIDHILNNDDRVLQFSRVREYYCVDVLVAFNSACSPLTKGILEPLLTCMLLLFAGLSFRISFKGGGGKKKSPCQRVRPAYTPLFFAPRPKRGGGHTKQFSTKEVMPNNLITLKRRWYVL